MVGTQEHVATLLFFLLTCLQTFLMRIVLEEKIKRQERNRLIAPPASLSTLLPPPHAPHLLSRPSSLLPFLPLRSSSPSTASYFSLPPCPSLPPPQPFFSRKCPSPTRWQKKKRNMLIIGKACNEKLLLDT